MNRHPVALGFASGIAFCALVALAGHVSRNAASPATHRAAHLLTVPPAVDYLVLDLEGIDPATLAIRPPDRTRALSLAALDLEARRWSPRLATLFLDHPAAGAWRFETPERGGRVRLRDQRFGRGGAPASQAPLRSSFETATQQALE